MNWVFLGAPGVGKGTYASRVAKLMGVPHVSCGDLVRDEIKAATPLAKQVCLPLLSAAACWYWVLRPPKLRCLWPQMAEITGKGQLLPDSLVLDLLRRRLAAGSAAGERGVLLDGFPRTLAQAVRALAAMRATCDSCAWCAQRAGVPRSRTRIGRSCWTGMCASRWR